MRDGLLEPATKGIRAPGPTCTRGPAVARSQVSGWIPPVLGSASRVAQGFPQLPAPEPVQHVYGLLAAVQRVFAVQGPVPAPVQHASGRSKDWPAATHWLLMLLL